MYDDDLFSMLNSYTATDTEQQESQETTSASQTYTPFHSTSSPYVDDYSTAQNFEEESSYNSFSNNDNEYQTIKQPAKPMETPTIKKQEQAVRLTKTREKFYLSSRLKLAATVFAIIFAALIFATIWNFAQASRLNAGLNVQQTEISRLTSDISELTVEYNKATDTSNMDGYVDKVDGVNSFKISLDNFYVEPEVEKYSSNWFNDVCEFFSNLFA